MKFSQLTVGQVFEFNSVDEFPYSGLERGPWVKISPRKYAKKGIECRIGSTGTGVHLVEVPKPTWDSLFF